ncbi:MAG: pitrilysin family protein, partial [Pseudomonadota bacterium]
MVLAVSGNVDHDEVVALAKEHFTNVPQGKPAPAEPTEYVGGYHKQPGQIQQAHFALAFKSVGQNHPDYYAHVLASRILGGGMSSRLFEEVRKKRSLVYTTSAALTGNEDSGMMYAYGGTTKDELAEMVPVLAKEVVRLSQDASQEELDKVRRRLMTALAGQQEAMGDRRDSLGREVLRDGKVTPLDELKEKLEAVTIEDIRRVAADWRRSPPTVSGYGQVEKMPSYEEIKGMLPPPLAPDRMYSLQNLAGLRPGAEAEEQDISHLLRRKPAANTPEQPAPKRRGLGM